MDRRRFLKATGGIGTTTALGGAGLLAMSGSAAALNVDISASNPAAITNDRGDISKVTIDPSFRVEWSGFDDAVAKIFYLVEAKVGQSGTYSPIFRATPWLNKSGPSAYPSGVHATKPGTTGHYEIRSSLSQAIAADPRYDKGSAQPPRPIPRSIEAVNEQGRPDYENASYSNLNSVDDTSYLNGVSMGSAVDAESELVGQGLPLVNNFPVVNSGYYGAAADTSGLDNDADGTSATNEVWIRYTFELQRPNDGLVNSVNDPVGQGVLSDVEQSDVDSGNSKIVMNGEDGNTNFGNPDGIPYDNLQQYAADHVGIMVEEAKFNVTANNVAAESGVTGSTNPGAQ